MGSWDVNSFGNDTACDWGYKQEEQEGLNLVESTLRNVVDTGNEYLEAPVAEEAIAAAEVVARVKGNFGIRDSHSEAIDQWVAKHPVKPAPALVEMALKAIQRILTEPSELLELWKESDEFDNWKQSIEDLKSRVSR